MVQVFLKFDSIFCIQRGFLEYVWSFCNGEVIDQLYTGFFLASLSSFSSDNDDAIGSSCTPYGCAGAIFQNSYAFNVIRIKPDIADVAWPRKIIDHHQRIGAKEQGISATNKIT